jgi:hypothetical protein
VRGTPSRVWEPRWTNRPEAITRAPGAAIARHARRAAPHRTAQKQRLTIAPRIAVAVMNPRGRGHGKAGDGHPAGENRSSEAAVKLPITLILVTPDMMLRGSLPPF